MKADVTLAGDTLHVTVENPERRFDGTFAVTFESPIDTVKLVSQLRALAIDIEGYAQALDDKLPTPPKTT